MAGAVLPGKAKVGLPQASSCTSHNGTKVAERPSGAGGGPSAGSSKSMLARSQLEQAGLLHRYPGM